MRKSELVGLVCLGIAAVLLLPIDGFATEISNNPLITSEMKKQGLGISGLIWNLVVPSIATTFGGIHGMKALMSNEYQRAGAYGLLVAGVWMLPQFIDAVSASSVLIP